MSEQQEHPSPGQIVQRAMDEIGWSQSDLAFALNTPTASVSQIVSDKRGISHNMAKALSIALGLSAERLVTAQAIWDMRKADAPDAVVSARSRILARYPLRDMIKRGWIDPDSHDASLEQQICRFFSVDNLDDVPHLAHAAKKTGYEDIPPAQLAWLFRVRQIASEIVVPHFNAAMLTEKLNTLSDMRSDPTLIRRIPQILSDCGVRFIVVEGLPGSKIDGVCFWLDQHSPVIGMSLRFDRIDNFWFVLRHEISHVLNRHGQRKPIIDNDVNDPNNASESEEERIANADASDFCVPSKKFENFYLRKKPLFPDRDVSAFAKISNVHPGLVVGQLQRKMGRYDLLRHHLVKIREHLAQSMMFDGWGDMIPTER